MFCLEVSFVKALPVFNSSVTVRVQLSGAAAAKPHCPGGVGGWSVVAEGALQAGTVVWTREKKSNTESWKLLCAPRKVRLGTAAGAKLSRADYTLPEGLSCICNIRLLEQYCSVTKCIQVLWRSGCPPIEQRTHGTALYLGVTANSSFPI